MLLIKNAEVHSPVFLGIKDILIAGEKIIAVENEIDARALKSIEIITIDGTGKRVIPGLIDAHVHVAGAGGEGGPATVLKMQHTYARWRYNNCCRMPGNRRVHKIT